jgi:uncharacterized membrane protein
MDASQIFTEEVKAEIVAAIEKAENETSGEIKLHVDNTCDGDVMNRVAFLFEKLKMDKTDLRNGVLFYVSTNDRKFAVIGDIGISEKVSDQYWDTIREVVLSDFKNAQFSEGLCKGIVLVGEQLKIHFPFQENDIHMLDNEISFEK